MKRGDTPARGQQPRQAGGPAGRTAGSAAMRTARSPASREPGGKQAAEHENKDKNKNRNSKHIQKRRCAAGPANEDEDEGREDDEGRHRLEGRWYRTQAKQPARNAAFWAWLQRRQARQAHQARAQGLCLANWEQRWSPAAGARQGPREPEQEPSQRVRYGFRRGTALPLHP